MKDIETSTRSQRDSKKKNSLLMTRSNVLALINDNLIGIKCVLFSFRASEIKLCFSESCGFLSFGTIIF